MQAGYRLISYADDQGKPVAGVLIAGRVIRASSALGGAFATVLDIIKSWDETHPRLAALCDDTSIERQGAPLSSVRLFAPILYPGAFYCAGANYWDHLNEMAAIAKQTTGRDVHVAKPAEPWFFLKTAAGSIIGDGAPARLPSFSKQVDWEAEIAAVIARPTRNISEQDALSAVAGYVIVNDLSARDLMKREGSIFVYDWIGQKCFEDAAPMGPWLTPSAYISDPNNLSIKLWVNGVLKQDSNTSKMVHNIAEQIAYLSRHITLQPGDVIATGTPAGVGLPKGEFLKAGDIVNIEIAELGTLTNTMIADAA
ncbi:fumarylacetoacetate hydrolase family protein [Pseudorhodoplanes sp.]|uniref:fumarylacetoacetate hydrolase family protein n=1 Tax=Pseudorhodoplanes sp. TaxID=1934341 RepID=UPI003919E43B